MVPHDDEAATVAASSPATPREASARFLPGTLLDKRYRVVAPLGRGGMGEVYRADDTKLGQGVALKFLPRALEGDARRLAMLLDEVRLARQVSHPNVCRVWDAGECDGLHFIAMEYVDGEDLGSLLRRIGRLPEDRALQVACELCAGLAAIHDQGLLHRDLKPANVMIDGRGRVRIADFGLAVLSGSVRSEHVSAGTPAYMAPEQLDGREVTRSSDLYSLGLVLYELFTGHRAFTGTGTSSRETTSIPETPSSHLRSLDPIIERAIMRCLEPAPEHRPGSALLVASALPGGDPLAVALAAGETPSPEMVAAAGSGRGLSTGAALALAAVTLALVGTFLALCDRRVSPFGENARPHAALRDRAADFALSIGARAAGDEQIDGFTRPRSGASAPDFDYWYRTSPGVIGPVLDERSPEVTNSFLLPALDVPGESAQRRALDGRLVEFRRMPAVADSVSGAAPDFGPWFAAAGLDHAACTAVRARAALPVPFDVESVWIAPTPKGSLRVSGAASGGVVTGFCVGEPARMPALTRAGFWSAALGALWQPLLMLLFAVMANRNMRQGRADTRGALRLGVMNGVLGLLGYQVLAQTHWRPFAEEVRTGIAASFYYSAFAVASYLALEPIVRRRRPGWLVSWARLLDGHWRDPVLGRDLLIGAFGGAALACVTAIAPLVRGTVAAGDFQAAAVGGWTALAVVLRGIGIGATSGLAVVLVLVLLQMALRRGLPGGIVWALFVAFMFGGTREWPAPLTAFAATGLLYALLRFGGITAVAIALAVQYVFNEEFHTLDLGSWHAGVSVAALLLLAGLLAWGVAASTKGSRAGAAAIRA